MATICVPGCSRDDVPMHLRHSRGLSGTYLSETSNVATSKSPCLSKILEPGPRSSESVSKTTGSENIKPEGSFMPPTTDLEVLRVRVEDDGQREHQTGRQLHAADHRLVGLLVHEPVERREAAVAEELDV